MSLRLTREQVEALEESINWCDALWDLDAERNMRDSRECLEYQNQSPVPRLREILARQEEQQA